MHLLALVFSDCNNRWQDYNTMPIPSLHFKSQHIKYQITITILSLFDFIQIMPLPERILTY